MSLKVITTTDLGQYHRDVRDDNALAFTFEVAWCDPEGISVGGGSVKYLDSRDRMYGPGRDAASSGDAFIMFDPLFNSTTAPNATAVVELTESLHTGQLDPDTLTQPFYQRRTAGATTMRVCNPITLAIGANAFPTGAQPGGITWTTSSGVSSNVPGGWALGDRINILIFQGLTEGVVGETALTGPGSYTAGLAMMLAQDATEFVSGDSDDALIWIDLSTGLGVGKLAIPGLVTTLATAPNSEAPIAGDVFEWDIVQYIPDADATLIAPKGELLLQSNPIPIEPTASTFRHYVRFADFNPTGKAPTSGNPSRTHMRITLTSRISDTHNPIFGQGGAPDGDAVRYTVAYHPPTRQLQMYLRPNDTTSSAADNRIFVRTYARVPDVDSITDPVAVSVTRTNDIITDKSFVGGDIGEPIAGEEVTWTLERVTTLDETVNASVFPGTSTLANFPVDDDAAGNPDLVLEADAVPLVLTTDYTIVQSTGVITWVTDQSGATLVTATYSHKTDPATPPHGQLLSGTSVTDGNGIATTRVSYADNDDLVGMKDKLSASV